MKFQKLFSVANALTVAPVIAFTGSVSTFAIDASQTDSVSQFVIAGTPSNVTAQLVETIHQINSSATLWRLSREVDFDAESLTVTQNGTTKKSPTTVADKNGIPVRTVYQENQSGIEIRTVLVYQDKDVWRCILRAGGNVILDGGSLGAVGVGVRTVFPGIGNVTGEVGDAIIGVIRGGMSGTAASCL